MRLISSICSSFRFQSKALRFSVACAVMLTSLTACTEKSNRTRQSDATGKGNGGNKLKMSIEEVDGILRNLKPRLQIVFEGLRYLALTEKTAPGSTDMQGQPEMAQHLIAMFDGEAPAIKDLATQDNVKPQGPACVDFRGVKNAAAAVLLDVGGPVCFSVEEIKISANKNFDRAGEIFVLALAAHEFTHHFISTGKHESDEKAARAIQDFVEQQLIRQVEIVSPNMISTDESQYLEQFRDYAKSLWETVLPQKEVKAP